MTTQENPSTQDEQTKPKQRFFRVPEVQKLGCKTYKQAREFVDQAAAGFKSLNPTLAAKAKVFARPDGTFDAILYIDKAKLAGTAEKKLKDVIKKVKVKGQAKGKKDGARG